MRLVFGLAFLLTAVIGPASATEHNRIVIAGGDLTEIAFALGAGDRVIAVDSTSTFPAEVKEREQIGYVRRLSAEGILSLTPDLVIVADDAGPPTALDQLKAAGVSVAAAPEGSDAASVSKKVLFMGDVLGTEDKATALATQIDADLERISSKIAAVEGSPKVMFVLSIRGNAPMVGGSGTSADAMIALAGGVNAVEGVEGYRPLSREAIISAAPDVILMMSQHAVRFGGVEEILARPEIALTPAGQAKRAITMDGMLLLGFGPRTPQAVRDLAKALHPGSPELSGL